MENSAWTHQKQLVWEWSFKMLLPFTKVTSFSLIYSPHCWCKRKFLLSHTEGFECWNNSEEVKYMYTDSITVPFFYFFFERRCHEKDTINKTASSVFYPPTQLEVFWPSSQWNHGPFWHCTEGIMVLIQPTWPQTPFTAPRKWQVASCFQGQTNLNCYAHKQWDIDVVSVVRCENKNKGEKDVYVCYEL